MRSRLIGSLVALCLSVPFALAPSVSAQVPKVVTVPVGVFQAPVAMTVGPDGDIYVVEKVGTIRAVRNGVIDPVPVLDISDEVSQGFEQGLLGLAFSAAGTHLYVNYTDTAGDTHVTEFGFAAGVANETQRRDLFTVDQPFANHNGGTLEFGPDGYLYISLGDGGSAGDPHGNGQNLNTLLGKILRIDPTPSAGQQYTIPPTNPFVGVAGARPEIWAYGLRNPWKYSFDAGTGNLWIADVGQGLWEEIDLQAAGSAGGQNYGWDQMEGTHTFDGGVEPANHVPPVYEYTHTEGRCSVTGGYVYRGTSASLAGKYIFGDFCEGGLNALSFDANGDPVVEDLGATVPLLTSFGQDASGELYAFSLAGPMYRLVPTGV